MHVLICQHSVNGGTLAVNGGPALPTREMEVVRAFAGRRSAEEEDRTKDLNDWYFNQRSGAIVNSPLQPCADAHSWACAHRVVTQ